MGRRVWIGTPQSVCREGEASVVVGDTMSGASLPSRPVVCLLVSYNDPPVLL